MPVDAKYTTTATASGGGRDGKTALADGTMALQLTVPKELGGPGGDGANPEKLFPTPRLCGERRHGAYIPHPIEAAGIAEVF